MKVAFEQAADAHSAAEAKGTLLTPPCSLKPSQNNNSNGNSND